MEKSKVLVLNGPSLSALGQREPEIYGSLTLGDVETMIQREAEKLGLEGECRQSNHEGELVDWVLEAGNSDVVGIVINPAAYTHTSLALGDALRAAGVPAVEVHLSNVLARETIRRRSLTAPACVGSISGLGPEGYLLALRYFSCS